MSCLGERGSLLLAVVLSAIVVSAAAAAMLTLGVNAQRQSHHQIRRLQARYAAEAAHHRVHQELIDDATSYDACTVAATGTRPVPAGCVLAFGGIHVTVTKEALGGGTFRLRFKTDDYDAALN